MVSICDMGKNKLVVFWPIVSISIFLVTELEGNVARSSPYPFQLPFNQAQIVPCNPVLEKAGRATQDDAPILLRETHQWFNPKHETVVGHLLVNAGFGLIPGSLNGSIAGLTRCCMCLIHHK